MSMFGSGTGRSGGTWPELPVYTLGDGADGRQAVITAGMDGDEYTGIEAAYRLHSILSKQEIRGSIVIIPVVNQAGFRTLTSRNPDDGKYLKHVYPGNVHGSASERLIRHLADTFIRGSSLWIDLHAGGLDEELTPCILTYETGNPEIDALTRSLHRHLSVRNLVYERSAAWQKVRNIARDGVCYCMFESGFGGSRKEADVRRHIAWVRQALAAAGFIPKPPARKRQDSVYRGLAEYVSQRAGLWYPRYGCGEDVGKGAVVGTIYGPDRTRPHDIRIRTGGRILWQRRVLPVARSDALLAVASDAQKRA